MNLGVQLFTWIYTIGSLNRFLRVGLVDHMMTMFSFWRNGQMFCKAAAYFSIPTTSVRRFQFFHILTNICFICFCISHPISFLELIYIPRFLMLLSILTFVCGHLYIVFEKNGHSYILPFFWTGSLVLNCKYLLYIPNVSPLLDTWFTDIFFHSVSCICFLDSGLPSKFFKKIINIVLGSFLLSRMLLGYTKNQSPTSKSQRLVSIFSKNFVVLAHAFRHWFVLS